MVTPVDPNPFSQSFSPLSTLAKWGKKLVGVLTFLPTYLTSRIQSIYHRIFPDTTILKKAAQAHLFGDLDDELKEPSSWRDFHSILTSLSPEDREDFLKGGDIKDTCVRLFQEELQTIDNLQQVQELLKKVPLELKAHALLLVYEEKFAFLLNEYIQQTRPKKDSPHMHQAKEKLKALAEKYPQETRFQSPYEHIGNFLRSTMAFLKRLESHDPTFSNEEVVAVYKNYLAMKEKDPEGASLLSDLFPLFDLTPAPKPPSSSILGLFTRYTNRM